MTGLSNGAPVDEVIERTYRLVAQAPSVIVSATLDDALAVEEPGAESPRLKDRSRAQALRHKIIP